MVVTKSILSIKQATAIAEANKVVGFFLKD